MKYLLFLFLFSVQGLAAESEESALTSFSASYKTKPIAVLYFKQIFGQIHQNPSRYSQTLSTVTCGQPIKLLQKLSSDGVEIKTPEGWSFISAGPYEGYLQTENLVAAPSECFAKKYPKFFETIDLELSEIHYWGRLYDQYVQGRSKVR